MVNRCAEALAALVICVFCSALAFLLAPWIPENSDLWLAFPVVQDHMDPGLYPDNDLVIESGRHIPFHFYRTAAYLYEAGVDVEAVWHVMFFVLFTLTQWLLWCFVRSVGVGRIASIVFIVLYVWSNPLKGTLHSSMSPLAMLITAQAAMPVAWMGLIASVRGHTRLGMMLAGLTFNIHPYLGLIVLVLCSTITLFGRGGMEWSPRLGALALGALTATPNLFYILTHVLRGGAGGADAADVWPILKMFSYHIFVETHWRDGYGWFLLAIPITLFCMIRVPPRAFRPVMCILASSAVMVGAYLVNLYHIHEPKVALLMMLRVTYILKPLMWALVVQGLAGWLLVGWKEGMGSSTHFQFPVPGWIISVVLWLFFISLTIWIVPQAAIVSWPKENAMQPIIGILSGQVVAVGLLCRLDVLKGVCRFLTFRVFAQGGVVGTVMLALVWPEPLESEALLLCAVAAVLVCEGRSRVVGWMGAVFMCQGICQFLHLSGRHWLGLFHLPLSLHSWTGPVNEDLYRMMNIGVGLVLTVASPWLVRKVRGKAHPVIMNTTREGIAISSIVVVALVVCMISSIRGMRYCDWSMFPDRDWGTVIPRIRFATDFSATSGLTTWARTATPRGSMFVVPPADGRFRQFRVLAQRGVYGIVHDMNQISFDPNLYVQAYRRVLGVGLEVKGRHSFLDDGYEVRVVEGINELAEKDGVDFVVLRRERLGPDLVKLLSVAYQDSSFVVVETVPKRGRREPLS